MRLLDGISDSMDMNLGKLQEVGRDRESLVCCSPWGRKELGTTEPLNSNNNPKRGTVLGTLLVRTV